MALGLLLEVGFSLVLAAVISVAIARTKGRSFSVPVFVVGVIVLTVVAAPIGREWQVDWELQHTPLYQQIAKSDPATLQLIRQVIVEGLENRRSDAETRSRIAAILGRALPGRMPEASDDSVHSYAGAMSNFLGRMSHTDPDACFYLMHPEKGEVYATPNDPELEKSGEQLLMAMGQMLESATNRPQPPPERQESQRLVQKMFASMRMKYGNDAELLRGGAVSAEERKKVCEMSADLFQKATEMPKKDGSMALRYLLFKTATQHNAP